MFWKGVLLFAVAGIWLRPMSTVVVVQCPNPTEPNAARPDRGRDAPRADVRINRALADQLLALARQPAPAGALGLPASNGVDIDIASAIPISLARLLGFEPGDRAFDVLDHTTWLSLHRVRDGLVEDVWIPIAYP